MGGEPQKHCKTRDFGRDAHYLGTYTRGGQTFFGFDLL